MKESLPKVLVPGSLIIIVLSVVSFFILEPLSTWGMSFFIGIWGLILFGAGAYAGVAVEVKRSRSRESINIQEHSELFQREIDMRKIREKELIDAQQAALQGVKAKDQFLSNMSHEIRTPMNGIIGLIGALSESNLTKEQNKYVSAIHYSAKSLLVLINEILDLSKINSEKLTLEKIDFDIRESIHSVEDTFHVTAAEKGIVLRTLVEPEVPQMINGDPVRLNQILLNLVGNAIKFTEEGGVDLIVKFAESNKEGIRLHVEVNDTGIGIPKDKAELIFDKFTQASDDTTRRFGGTGLGLAISKELVNLMDGKIQVESDEGKGSSFYFDILLGHAKNPKPVAAKEEKKKKTENTTVKDVKILIAEDNTVNQLVVTTALKKLGFKHVKVVPNGQEVIEVIFQESYDVILMDVHMPIMNGLDATRFIRNATDPPLNQIPILGMTASVMKEEIDRCIDSGMNGYVPKPFELEELFEAIMKFGSKFESLKSA